MKNKTKLNINSTQLKVRELSQTKTNYLNFRIE
jgi:hypothetical protein